MSTEETKTEQNYSNNMYNENNIPVPQKKDDGTIKIGKLTAEDIFKEMQVVNKEGYSANAITATFEKLHNVAKKGINNLDQEDRELIQMVTPEFCKTEFYALANDVWVVSLIFDSQNDAFLTELYDQLTNYKNMVMHERQKAMDDENYIPEVIPNYTISFIPYTLGGFGIGTFSDPIDYYKTLEDNGAGGLHILFSNDGMDFEQVTMTEDELTDVQAEVMREEAEKAETVYNSSF